MLSGETAKPATKPRLLIPRTILDAVIAQALREAPLECCGLLAGPMPPTGEDLRVVAHFELVNALKSPTEFESESRSLFEAHRTMRAKDWEILAVYHSHPTSPAVPSRKDRDRNYSEYVVNVIVSLQSPTPDVRAWWIAGDVVQEADSAVA